MHARHAKSDTPELDLCSCRHRELIGRSRPHGWWLCGRFCLKLRLIPLKRTTGNAAHTERFPGSAAGGSPLAAHCLKKIIPPASGTAGGMIFCTKKQPSRAGRLLFTYPYPEWRYCRFRVPQIRRCNRPYGRPTPRNCRLRPAGNPCRAAPAPRRGSHRKPCLRNP